MRLLRETSAALTQTFAERDIALITGRRVSALDPARSVAILDDGTELAFDLFLGVPKHRAPDVVIAGGLTEGGYVPVDSATLTTRLRGGRRRDRGRPEGRGVPPRPLVRPLGRLAQEALIAPRGSRRPAPPAPSCAAPS